VCSDIRAELERRRCGAEPAEDSGHGHAADYSWLVGEVHYVQVRGAWRLRYASPDEAERYGGTVTLSGDAVPQNLRNGQLLRVEGRLINPATREPSPVYEVQAAHLLASP
jgi:hypothetical protein